MKLLILFVVLVVACAIAMWLMTRIYETQSKLGELHSDLKRKENELQLRLGQGKSTHSLAVEDGAEAIQQTEQKLEETTIERKTE